MWTTLSEASIDVNSQLSSPDLLRLPETFRSITLFPEEGDDGGDGGGGGGGD